MKKTLFLFALVVMGITSCKKEDDAVITSSSEERQIPLVEYVPSAFTQKLLMEMYSTTGCATCPDAEQKYRVYAANHADKVYGVCIHNSDAMDHPQFDVLDNLFNINVYSSGSFNRLAFSNEVVLPKTSWTNNIVNTCLSKTAACGLKINSTYTGNIADVTVTAGFNTTLSGDYHLTIYLLEDSVSGSGSGYNQSNYYNNISSSIFYQLGNPIVGYQHDYVLRQVLTSPIGETIPQTLIKRSGTFSKHISFSIAGYDHSQLYIIAFINKTGSTALTHEVKNVQQVKLGSNKSWD
ncbi:MAG: Omp28-related outer membrane protein [Bacteroidota bacterium]